MPDARYLYPDTFDLNPDDDEQEDTIDLPPNWATILAEDPDTWSPDIVYSAKHWATCAIGEAVMKYGDLIRLYPSGITNGPVDPTLSNLGLAFMNAMLAINAPLARSCYRQIQTRIRQLQTENTP